MAKELERAGMPTALITAMVGVATAVGASRVVRAAGILSPLGDPTRTPDEEARLRERIVRASLEALLSKPDGSQVFEP